MNITRRTLLAGAASGLAGGVGLWREGAQAADKTPALKIRIGSYVVGLADGKRAGLEGVEVRAGNPADTLELADPAVRAKYKEQMKETGLVIPSIMMGLLNSNPLASDPRGPAWLEQTIDGAKDVGAKVILVAFFGKGSLLEGNEVKKA